MDESPGGQNRKTWKGMTDNKIGTVVNSQEGKRDNVTREQYRADFQCICNVFFHTILSE